MNKQTYLLHAVSPLHAGVGQAVELIDMPIARMKGTGIPFVPGSSIKGVLRDAAKEQNWKAGEEKTVFGPDRDKDEAKDNAGSLICTDARLLALPVRSFEGTFAYVTSPLLLTLASRDLDNAPPAPTVLPNQIIAGPAITEGATVYLEDLDLARKDPSGTTQDPWMKLLSKPFDPAGIFSTRFAVVHDGRRRWQAENDGRLGRVGGGAASRGRRGAHDDRTANRTEQRQCEEHALEHRNLPGKRGLNRSAPRSAPALNSA